MYLLVTVIFDTNMYSITVICSIFLYFKNELLSTIMCTVIYYCVEYFYLMSYIRFLKEISSTC